MARSRLLYSAHGFNRAVYLQTAWDGFVTSIFFRFFLHLDNASSFMSRRNCCRNDETSSDGESAHIWGNRASTVSALCINHTNSRQCIRVACGSPSLQPKRVVGSHKSSSCLPLAYGGAACTGPTQHRANRHPADRAPAGRGQGPESGHKKI